MGALIVKKRNDEDAFGIVRVRDLISGVIIPDRTSLEVNVYEIMVKPVITIPGRYGCTLCGQIACSDRVAYGSGRGGWKIYWYDFSFFYHIGQFIILILIILLSVERIEVQA